MESTLNFFAASLLSAPPMLYRDPSRPMWASVAPRAGEMQDTFYVLDSLAPNTFASKKEKTLVDALEYASVVARVSESGLADGLITEGSPSKWTYLSYDGEPGTAFLHVYSVEEEFYVASYNAAAACMQAAVMLWTRWKVEGCGKRALRLTLTAQNILRCLHDARAGTDAIASGAVRALSAADGETPVPGPVQVYASCIDILTTFVHAQLTEMQLIQSAEGQDATVMSRAFSYLGDVYDACRTALEAHRQSSAPSAKARFSVVPGKLDRLVAYKRHASRCIAAFHFLGDKEMSNSAAACSELGKRYLEEARKSLNKTQSALNIIEQKPSQKLANDPLVFVRDRFASDLGQMEDEFSLYLDNQSSSPSPGAKRTAIDGVINHIAAEDALILNKLSQQASWTVSNFTAKIKEFAIKCRHEIAPSAELALKGKVESAMQQVRNHRPPRSPNNQPTPESRSLSHFDLLKRLYLLHRGTVKFRQNIDHNVESDVFQLERCERAMVHVSAITKAVLFRDLHVRIEEVVLIGKLISEEKLDSARQRLGTLMRRSETEIASHLPIVCEAQEQLRMLLKNGQ